MDSYTIPNGSIYAIRFSNGVVKVGKSLKAKSRIESHSRGASVHGAEITDSWFSELHNEYEDNEKAMIEFCSSIWEASGGREWFKDADWDRIVEFAKGLSFSSEERVMAASPMIEAMKRTIGAGTGKIRTDTLDELDELVLQISITFGIELADARKLYAKPHGCILFWKYVELYMSYEDASEMIEQWFDFFSLAIECQLGKKDLVEEALKDDLFRAALREIYGFHSPIGHPAIER